MRAEMTVLEFIHDLQKLDSIPAVSERFQKLIGEFGFNYYFMGAFTPQGVAERQGRTWSSTYRHEWFRQWARINGGWEDPVLNRLRNDYSPLRWSSLRDNPETPGLHLLDAASEFGLNDGWSLAFQDGRDGPPIAIGLGTDHYALRPEDETALHLGLVYVGLKVARLDQAQPTVQALLSDRERECLCWVAAGKTDCDISEIIGISQQTVHKHVSNALKKLNAGTRAQAVAVALSSSQIKL